VSFSVVSGPATLKGNVLKITGAGTVKVEALQAGNAAYSAAIPVDESFTVSPALLTITANDATMVQGSAVPLLSVRYRGFVNGDSPVNLSKQPVITTLATPLSAAGTYPIVAGGASSPNYVISYTSGVLVVTPAPVKVLDVSIQAVRLGKSKKKTQVIVLQFSGSLNTADSQSLGNYSVAAIPGGKKQKPKAVPLAQATYNPANNTVRLVTRRPLIINPPLRITINAARLFDTIGRALDGDGDGQPGGNFVAKLHIALSQKSSSSPGVPDVTRPFQ
jgi:MBG domain-containing protein